MNNSEITNPAHRARLFLEQFSNQTGQVDGVRVPLIRHSLSTIYSFNPEDNSSLMIVMSDAWKLPGQIRIDLQKSGLDEDDYNDAIVSLENFLRQMNFDSQSQAVKNNMPTSLIPSLRMISGILNKTKPEVSLTELQISDILESIDTLSDDIRNSKLEDEFTDYLLHRLDSIRYAILHYDVLGQDELMRRVDEMFGGVFLQYGKLANGKKKKDFIHRLMGIGAVIIYAIGAFNDGIQLPESINKFIEFGVIQEASIVSDRPEEVKDPSDSIA